MLRKIAQAVMGFVVGQGGTALVEVGLRGKGLAGCVRPFYDITAWGYSGARMEVTMLVNGGVRRIGAMVFFMGLLAGAAGQENAMAADAEASKVAISGLQEYLAKPASEREDLTSSAFAEVALTKTDAATAQSLLWEDYVSRFKKARAGTPPGVNEIKWNDLVMRYAYKTFGDKPAGGRSLFISMHGGGGAPAYVNDQQWANQINLYQPAEGIYLAPRAPTDSWNMWHQGHIDPLFEQLIRTMVIMHEVNPNRVYLMGYSAGGDGVYQLAPRMADRWAAATAAAGHPNEASPLGLRNIGFSIHVGEHDSPYNRNGVAREWQQKLAVLQAQDPGGYTHAVHIHAGLAHWMNLQDAVAVPWMAQFTRKPLPQQVVWQQDDVVHQRFYWLGVDPAKAQPGQLIKAAYQGQVVTVEAPAALPVQIYLNDAMADLDQPIKVNAADGRELFYGVVARTIARLAASLELRGDENFMASGQIDVVAQP